MHRPLPVSCRAKCRTVRPRPHTPRGERAGRLGLLARLVPLILLWPPGPVIAQAGDVTDDDAYVVSMEFLGVESVDAAELRGVLATQATRCRSVLYKPLCWITSSHLFEAKYRLNRQELERDELRIRVFYFRRGWRDARARSEVVPDGDRVRVTFIVEEGQPTLVEALVIESSGSDLDESEIRRSGLPAEGRPLDLVAIDSARLRLSSRLWDRGYADAVIDDTAHVDDAADVARLEVRIEPGARATVESIEVAGNEGVSDRTLRRLLGLREGQLYRRADVLAAQRRLYASEMFRQALITVPEEADSAKPIRVTVREAPFRAVRTGIGFTTVEFGQVEAGFTVYDWLGGGRRLDLDVGVGNLMAPQLYGRSLFGSAVPDGFDGDVESGYLDPTWRFSAQVTQPWLFSPRNSLGLRAFAHRRSVPGIVVDRGWGAEASITHRLDEQSPVSLRYRFERTRIDAGQVYFCASFGVCRPEITDALASPHRLSPLGLTVHVDRADDPLSPTRGYSAQLDLEHASSATASDFAYNRGVGELAYYRPVGSFTLAARVRGGLARALSGTDRHFSPGAGGVPIMHPRKRLFAGGARSVRGFGEGQLGPRILVVDPERLLAATDSAAGCTPASIEDGSCDPEFLPSNAFAPRPIGGESLVEGSVELRVPLSDVLIGAVFLDAGRVGAARGSTADARTAMTPGFGVRYRSPVGPIRIDLGIRPGGIEDLAVITQVGSGREARLVQLDATRRYDPLGDSGGFIRRVFSRLRLHLAVGESF